MNTEQIAMLKQFYAKAVSEYTTARAAAKAAAPDLEEMRKHLGNAKYHSAYMAGMELVVAIAGLEDLERELVAVREASVAERMQEAADHAREAANETRLLGGVA